MSSQPNVEAAVEVIAATGPGATVVLTCEHASNVLPPPWTWPEEDRRLVDLHWAWDLGAAALTRRLAAALGCPAVLARFSRLLVDANRPLDSDTLFRDVADGVPIRLNAAIDAEERALRLQRFYEPYHRAVHEVVEATPGALVLGMHSFTDVYEGQPRQVEIGVLFDRDRELAEAWLEALDHLGYDARLNEPWSGLAGLMYAPQRHATCHGRRCLELELRQDLLADEAHVTRLLDALVGAVERLHPAG